MKARETEDEESHAQARPSDEGPGQIEGVCESSRRESD
jgi:hypothetical protein